MEKKTPDADPFLFENKKGRLIPLDDINLDIVRHMLNDPAVSDSALSAKLNVSDENIKRRRKAIEDGFLTKNYLIDVSALGWRMGDIQVDVGKGKSEEIAERIFQMFPNTLEASLRIDSSATVNARMFYRDSKELDDIMEKIKHFPSVKDVAFSEIVRIVRSRSIGTMKDILVPSEEMRVNTPR